MAGKSIISRVENLEKAIKEVNIKVEKLDKKLEKLAEMEKTMESLTRGLARVSSALDDTKKRTKSPAMKKFDSELVVGERAPADESAVIFQSPETSNEFKVGWDGLAEDYLLEEALMDHQTFIYLHPYPEIGPKEKLLKIKGKIQDKEVIVLIKNDTTHNFISKELVQELGLSVLEMRGYMVMTDVSCVIGDRICMYVSLDLPGLKTKVHFLPLEMVDGVDIIMGSKWLDTLEDVKIYCEDGICRMKFVEGNEVIMWEADPNL